MLTEIEECEKIRFLKKQCVTNMADNLVHVGLIR